MVMKFQPLFGSFDLVAKAPILNMHQFNGEYGCPSCLHPGVHTSSRYYLPGTEYPLRTNDNNMQNATEAEERGKPIKGIKAGAYAGGGSGGSGEPPFFQFNYIHRMAWHACLACK